MHNQLILIHACPFTQVRMWPLSYIQKSLEYPHVRACEVCTLLCVTGLVARALKRGVQMNPLKLPPGMHLIEQKLVKFRWTKTVIIKHRCTHHSPKFSEITFNLNLPIYVDSHIHSHINVTFDSINHGTSPYSSH